ncbi:MAG TPA: hypothetical protein VNN79_24175 [Actinomycetota bacterium]|nr:hypothetical protein [Actinomycetota bacterium]
MTELVTSEGKRAIDEWQNAIKMVDQARSRLRNAEGALETTEERLAKWMLPEDATVGEKIAVWHGDSLIQVEVLGLNPLKTKISIRTRGKHGFEQGLRVA